MIDILNSAMLSVAEKNGIMPCTAQSTFINQRDNGGVLVLPGAVYGFCVRLTNDERISVFQESQEKNTNRIAQEHDWIPIKEDIYPLYWGKDKSLGERIYRHLKNNSKSTGLVRFCAYSTLIGKKIACLTLTVTKFEILESELRKIHTDLLKTSTELL